ncbi:MAG: ABC transporter substrate-binding protein, partial [Selenomonadaceae bacterium]|nr:ABC transporter substrate-binding protein [Selenomonadaceae bacterium]
MLPITSYWEVDDVKKFLAAIFATTILMTGCGDENISKDDKNTFIYGTVSYGEPMETMGTNPHENYSGWSTLRYGIGETLFKFNDNMELEPWLAESFERLDDYTIRIKIKDNVKFSNGKDVNGIAVKRCLETLVAVHDRAPKDLELDSIIANGNFVTIKSKEKVPSILNYLSDPYACIIDVNAGEIDNIVVGTGPYKAVVADYAHIELVPNENYWGEVKPKLKRIIVRGINDGDTLAIGMYNGEFDAVQGVPFTTLKMFVNGYKISRVNTSRVYQITFNFDTPELQDINVRRAISMAIDKENFTKVLLEDNGTIAVGAFPANMPFGDEKVNAPSYNLINARKLLAAAGWQDTNGDGYVDKDGKNLELRYLTYTLRPELPMLAGVTQADLKLIGIKLEVNATNDYRHFLEKGEYDLYCNSIVTAPTGDP